MRPRRESIEQWENGFDSGGMPLPRHSLPFDPERDLKDVVWPPRLQDIDPDELVVESSPENLCPPGHIILDPLLLSMNSSGGSAMKFLEEFPLPSGAASENQRCDEARLHWNVCSEITMVTMN